jgi:nicotinamidase-related amidase
MLTRENTVLIVIDIQGKLASLMHRRDEFYDNVVRMIKGAQVLEIPIIWNEQIPDKLGPTVDKIKEALNQAGPLVKTSFSCCGNPVFNKTLANMNRKQALLVGMETHVCVYQTAIDLLNNGYVVHLVADAVSSRIPENIDIGRNAIAKAGAHITSVEMSLLEILKEAQGDQFREIIKIIK